MWDMITFLEPDEKRTNYTSNPKKHVVGLHDSLFLIQNCFILSQKWF